MKPVHVLGDTAVYNLGITKLPFDNQKRMLHFTSAGRLSVFDRFVPVESCIAGRDLETGGPDICPEFDVPEVLIILDLRPLLCSAVSGITVADFVIFPQKIRGFIDVMDICGCSVIVWT